MLEFEKRPYRPCAGICLINNDNKVFVGQRIDSHNDAWQMPQGGIDEGETPKQAALREMLEEIGTAKATIIAQLETPLDYNLPPELADKMWHGQFKGQRQYWFLLRFTGNDSDINLQTLHPEFKAFKWVDIDIVPSLAIHFKRDIYKTVISEFKMYFITQPISTKS
jgi:putative (di)nucleoside polyphosphate hydrolase